MKKYNIKCYDDHSFRFSLSLLYTHSHNIFIFSVFLGEKKAYFG